MNPIRSEMKPQKDNRQTAACISHDLIRNNELAFSSNALAFLPRLTFETQNTEFGIDLGRFPFNLKFRKSRMKSEWKGHFPESHFGILGVPREVVPIFRKIGITGKFCSIRPFLLGPVSPRPKLKVNMATTQQFQCSKS